MASVARDRKFPLGLTVIVTIALILAGMLAVQWVANIVWSIVQMLLIVVAIYAVVRLGLYLLRNGGSRPPQL